MGVWVDVLIVLVSVPIVYIQSKRGMIPTLIEFFGAYGAFVLVSYIKEPVAESVHLFARPETNLAFFHIFLFVMVCVPVVVFGVFLDNAIVVSLDVFDTILGAAFGFAAAVIVCHVIVEGMMIGAVPGGAVETSIRHSPLADEALNFTLWHEFLGAVARLGVYEY